MKTLPSHAEALNGFLMMKRIPWEPGGGPGGGDGVSEMFIFFKKTEN